MTAIAVTPSAIRIELDGVATPGSATRMLAALGRLFRAYHNRCAVASLDGFSDDQLADIGLTRGDLHDGLAEPYWRDPTRLMRDRAAKRLIANLEAAGPGS
jgi:uncharacterized protein YjiS (DUF1127 family)